MYGWWKEEELSRQVWNLKISTIAAPSHCSRLRREPDEAKKKAGRPGLQEHDTWGFMGHVSIQSLRFLSGGFAHEFANKLKVNLSYRLSNLPSLTHTSKDLNYCNERENMGRREVCLAITDRTLPNPIGQSKKDSQIHLTLNLPPNWAAHVIPEHKQTHIVLFTI
jgi:hypothetical protein